jgi:hypothetical protein
MGEAKMRHLMIALSVLLCQLAPAQAQVAVGIGIELPGVSIGISMPAYPNLVRVPGYPVYYDPRANSNYFFYDGMYWVFQGDNWYAGTWYNGPWRMVAPQYVPLFVLRVPVRYYRQPPMYFRGWNTEAPPRWGDHWGRDWEQHRSGWDRWDRHSAPAPAPLPVYQRQYSGSRYPNAIEQQHAIRSEKYRYQPHEAVTQQHYQQRPKGPPRQPEHEQNRVQQPQRAPQQQGAPQQQQQQPAHQAQPSQPTPKSQRPQAEAQDKGRNNTPAQHDRGDKGDKADKGKN